MKFPAYGHSLVARLSLCSLVALASCSGGAQNVTPAAIGATDGVANATRSTLANVRAATVPLVPPAGTIYFGAYVNYLNQLGPYETQTAAFEQQIGRPLAVHSEYYGWNDSGVSFPGAPEVDDYKVGRIPLISWDCGDTSLNVANGVQDSVIIAQAQKFIAYRHLVFVRYFWEMNLPWNETYRPQCYDKVNDKNNYFNPANYVLAWNHIRSVFAAQGVKNVVWVWNISGSLTVDPLPYYPGASETDWVGFDHYDVTGTVGLQNTLAAPYAKIQPLGKPIMVGETGELANSQPTYLNSAPSILQTDFPSILAFVYYDAKGTRADWRLTTAGIAAFKAAGATTYFSAMVKRHSKKS